MYAKFNANSDVTHKKDKCYF